VPEVVDADSEVDAACFDREEPGRARKVLREIGVPTSVVNSRSSRPMLLIRMYSATASSQSLRTPTTQPAPQDGGWPSTSWPCTPRRNRATHRE